MFYVVFSSNTFLDESKYDEANANAVLACTTYQEFLQSNKIVNSLDNPLGGAVPALPQLATDLRAATHEYPGFTCDTFVRLMNWGLLAKADAVHRPHVDCTGMATRVAIEDGLKKWDLAFPPTEDAETEVATTVAYAGEMVWE